MLKHLCLSCVHAYCDCTCLYIYITHPKLFCKNQCQKGGSKPIILIPVFPLLLIPLRSNTTTEGPHPRNPVSEGQTTQPSNHATFSSPAASLIFVLWCSSAQWCVAAAPSTANWRRCEQTNPKQTTSV